MSTNNLSKQIKGGRIHSSIRGPFCIRRKQAAAELGISATKFDDLVHRGLLPKPFKIDGCTLWDWEDLREAYEELRQGALAINREENPWDRV